jgi:hypothetical protein
LKFAEFPDHVSKDYAAIKGYHMVNILCPTACGKFEISPTKIAAFLATAKLSMTFLY